MDKKIDLNQLWADEMNGKVQPGTYHKEFKRQYPQRMLLTIKHEHQGFKLLLQDYPNLEAVLEGRVSADHGEWSQVRYELIKLFFILSEKDKKIEELEEQLAYIKKKYDILG